MPWKFYPVNATTDAKRYTNSRWLATPDRQRRDHLHKQNRPGQARPHTTEQPTDPLARGTPTSGTGREAKPAPAHHPGRTHSGHHAGTEVRQPLPQTRLHLQPPRLLQRLARQARHHHHSTLRGLQTHHLRTLAEGDGTTHQRLPIRISRQRPQRRQVMNAPRNGSTRQWRKLRDQILKRDGGICWICGQPGADTVDHLVPWVAGGPSQWANLSAAHGRKRPEYNCPGNYSLGAKKKTKPSKRKRQPRPVLGETAPSGPLSWSGDPSLNLGNPYHASSKSVERKERPDGVEE